MDGVAVPEREVLSSDFAPLMEFRDHENLEILRMINVHVQLYLSVLQLFCLSTEPASIKAEKDQIRPFNLTLKSSLLLSAASNLPTYIFFSCVATL